MISILYVDDDPYLLELGKLCLEDTGEFHIDTVESARDALDILQHRDYDAVISDYQMPEMDGIDFLKILRKKNPTLPFIIFTGKGREEIAITAFENGADFYHQKGGDQDTQFAELSHKIRKSVEQFQTKLALREIMIQFHDYIKTASDHIRILDNDGMIVCDSLSTSHILGYPEYFLTGKYAMDFIHPEDRETIITAFNHVRNRKNPGIPIDFRIRKADGVYIGVELIAMNIVRVNGDEGFVVTTVTTSEKNVPGWN